jgi:hypothetical protein
MDWVFDVFDSREVASRVNRGVGALDRVSTIDVGEERRENKQQGMRVLMRDACGHDSEEGLDKGIC